MIVAITAALVTPNNKAVPAARKTVKYDEKYFTGELTYIGR